MDSTRNPYATLTSLSDLEARLFDSPVPEAANAAAYVRMIALASRAARAANVQPQLPGPPISACLSLVESVLLRAI